MPFLPAYHHYARAKTIIADLVKAGVRNKVKVLVDGTGHANYADEIGARHTPDAASAAQIASYFKS